MAPNKASASGELSEAVPIVGNIIPTMGSSQPLHVHVFQAPVDQPILALTCDQVHARILSACRCGTLDIQRLLLTGGIEFHGASCRCHLRR